MIRYPQDVATYGHPSIDNTPHPFIDKSGPDTYLHAGHGKGWPNDHSVDDTYECPPHTWVKPEALDIQDDRPEYKAEFTGNGGAILVLYTPARIIATFDTFADAQTAAEALNNHKGY